MIDGGNCRLKDLIRDLILHDEKAVVRINR